MDYNWPVTDDSSVKKSEGVDRRMTDIATTNAKVPEKIVSRVPTIKKSPTLADQILIETQSMKPGSSIDTKPAPTPPPRRKPTLSTDQDEKLKENSTKPGSRGAGAIAWEKAEMAKIRKRYEQMKNQILLWEDEKKRKAKRRLDRKEGKLERRRQRALQHFSNETAKINQIAQAARENMERQRKKEESEVKEKANKIRSTGKVPVTCFCF
uniref:Remorin C-terminal domain-containing protein n=1 Tax=Nelumbo nucifera TaxID=4432 RepID=A0A822YLD5_NELNU|nr:TPA_asm: hypothetical protein HUJ06_005623 [Nelumbo nucifera]